MRSPRRHGGEEVLWFRKNHRACPSSFPILSQGRLYPSSTKRGWRMIMMKWMDPPGYVRCSVRNLDILIDFNMNNVRRDIGPPTAIPEGAARSMTMDELVDLCRLWDLDPSGDRDEMARQVMQAQEDHAPGGRPWPPGGSGEGIIAPGTLDADPSRVDG